MNVEGSVQGIAKSAGWGALFRSAIDSLPRDVAFGLALAATDYCITGEWAPHAFIEDRDYFRLAGISFYRRGDYWEARKQRAGRRVVVYVGRVFSLESVIEAVAEVERRLSPDTTRSPARSSLGNRGLSVETIMREDS